MCVRVCCVANNPDVALPATQANRLWSLLFVVFLVFGCLLMMNLVLASIYQSYSRVFKAKLASKVKRVECAPIVFLVVDVFVCYALWCVVVVHSCRGSCGEFGF